MRATRAKALKQEAKIPAMTGKITMGQAMLDYKAKKKSTPIRITPRWLYISQVSPELNSPEGKGLGE